MSVRPVRLSLALNVVLVCGAGPAAERTPVRLDRHGDPLPAGARARLGSLRFRTSVSATGSSGPWLHVSPDGRVLALDEFPKVVRLLDAASGKELRRVRAGCFGCFSPDSRVMATGNGNGTLDLWEVATGKRTLRLPGHKLPPATPGDPEWRREYDTLAAFQMAFSADGKSFASWGCDRTWRRWDVATGKELQAWRPKAQGPYRFVLSTDARTLLEYGGADHGLRLWDASTGKVRCSLPRQDGGVMACRWSPDGHRLAVVTNPDALHLFAVDSGRELWKANGWFGPWPWGCLCFTPDGHVVATSEKGLGLLEAATGREVRTWPGMAECAGSLAVLPDGRALVAHVGAAVRFWDLPTGKEWPVPEGHTDAVCALAFTAGGRLLVSLSDDHTVRLWETVGGKLIRTLRSRGEFCPYRLGVSADGKVVVAGGGGARPDVLQWDAGTGRLVRRYRFLGPGGLDNSVLFVLSPDGKTLVSDDDDDYAVSRVSDTASGKVVRTLPARLGQVRGQVSLSAFFPDGKTLAVGEWSDETSGRTFRVSLWDVTSGRNLREVPTREGDFQFASQFAVSADGKALGVWGEGKLTLWEVATGQQAGQFDLPRKRRVSSMVFTSRGKLLALAEGDDQGVTLDAVEVWDLRAGKRIYRGADTDRGRACVALSPDGQTLATGHPNGTVLLWDVPAPERSAERHLADKEQERLWADLAGADATRAFGAVRTLTASPRQAVALLAERLRPVPAGRVARLIAELDSDSFDAREAASAALSRLGAEAEPALRVALEGKPSPEVRRRARELLRALPAGPHGPTAKEMRASRAVQALEQIGTPEARRLLEALAKGAAEARLTREAAAALGRLAPRQAAGP
jgi:WD40 repeat protein